MIPDKVLEVMEEACRSGRDPMSISPEEFRVRDCGGCQACCDIPAIEKNQIGKGELDISKPACSACRFQGGEGCSIYDRRPSVCEGYACGYIIGMIDERPDESGVLGRFNRARI